MNPSGFYLGTHMPHWLADASYPLFVAYHRLADRKTMPRAAFRWMWRRSAAIPASRRR